MTWRELIKNLQSIPAIQLDDMAIIRCENLSSPIAHININIDNREESIENEMDGPTCIHVSDLD